MADSWTALATVLAVFGGAALILRLVGSAMGLLLWTAEAATASGMADVSERRGDLTTLAERREHQERAKHRRRRTLILGIVWLLWLAIPIFGGWLPEAYAPAAALWLFGRPAGRRAARR